ncbi:site-2 protease family protein [Candidatus Woesearchaeota archaeon]|nr:site-2 protease family protein [Candidatus Woesearchaeota archaeon]
MTVDGLFAVVFIVALAVFLWARRSRIEVQKALFPLLYVIMYRSSFGLSWMKRFAQRFPRILRVLGDIGTGVGFLGMALIAIELIRNTIMLFTGSGVPGVQPVLPIEAKGVFYIPFSYWIISIFLIALVHEFAHGVLANVHKMRVKSSGFAFLSIFVPIIPAAFVEPDEVQLSAKPARSQLAVFAAGPFSNIIFAVLMFGILALFNPLLSMAFLPGGVELTEVSGPALDSGLKDGDILIALADQPIHSSANVSTVLSSYAPGDIIEVGTKDAVFNLTLGSSLSNESRPYMGIKASPHLDVNETFAQMYGSVTPMILKWVSTLFVVLFMLNIGIGLFNLLPLGPLDGGRMFQLVCVKLFRKNGIRVWSYVSLFFVVLIFVNLVVGLITV